MKLFYALMILLLMSGTGYSQTVESEILQIQYNRIYFPLGEEAGLYPGTVFSIKCDTNSLLEGRLDFVGPGISYSESIPEINASIIKTDCLGYLTVAGIDREAEINLGTDLPLNLFNDEHETILTRNADSLEPVLVDSFKVGHDWLELYLKRGINFSDGSRLDAEAVIWWLTFLKQYASDYTARYFCSRIKAPEDGGLEAIDGYSVLINFISPFPRAAYQLSYPALAVFNHNRSGSGCLMEVPTGSPDKKSFETNPYYRGAQCPFKRLTIHHFSQPYRMHFAFEEGQLDGYIGFGFDDVLAGSYAARALYPYTAVFIPGLDNDLNKDPLFATSLYYRFDPQRAHLYFPYGNVKAVNRWLTGEEKTERYFEFDFIKGKNLHKTLRLETTQITAAYDETLLTECTRYFADITAREGISAEIVSRGRSDNYAFHLAFVPSSDSILPLALIACVLDLNDQNSKLDTSQQREKPGWVELAAGTTLYETRYRNNYFRQAVDTVVQEFGCFPLFRPEIFAVGGRSIKNIDFDFYGFPHLDHIIKLETPLQDSGQRSEP